MALWCRSCSYFTQMDEWMESHSQTDNQWFPSARISFKMGSLVHKHCWLIWGRLQWSLKSDDRSLLSLALFPGLAHVHVVMWWWCTEWWVKKAECVSAAFYTMITAAPVNQLKLTDSWSVDSVGRCYMRLQEALNNYTVRVKLFLTSG